MLEKSRNIQHNVSHTLFRAKDLLKKPRMRRSQKLYATLHTGYIFDDKNMLGGYIDKYKNIFFKFVFLGKLLSAKKT